jgi:membrane protein required for beta-lactamase induction
MRLFPRIDFLRKMYNRDAELATIDKDISAAVDIADPGERLLRYDALESQSRKVSLGVMDKMMVPGIITFLGGVVTTVASLCMGHLLLAVGAVALIYGELAASRELGADAMEAADRRADTSMAAKDAMITGTDPKAFAASSQFEKVMYDFPKLREKFILAAAREKFTPEVKATARPAGLNL